jgi:hypothetical protein
METKISMQQLKQQRATPAEKFVLDTIKGVRPGEPDKDGSIYWIDGENDNRLFRQNFKNNYLWVSYDYILEDLKYHYGLSYDDMEQLLTKLLYKYTNKGQLKISL